MKKLPWAVVRHGCSVKLLFTSSHYSTGKQEKYSPFRYMLIYKSFRSIALFFYYPCLYSTLYSTPHLRLYPSLQFVFIYVVSSSSNSAWMYITFPFVALLFSFCLRLIIFSISFLLLHFVQKLELLQTDDAVKEEIVPFSLIKQHDILISTKYISKSHYFE